MKQCILIFLLLIGQLCSSQINQTNEQPFIEVVGTAIQNVVPDKIYIEINLSEKVVNRKNYTIREQETNLKRKLEELKIGLDNLSLSDSNTFILRNKRRETGVKITKEFLLLVHTSEEVNNVFKALNEINIKEASIKKTEHSKITDIRKDVRKEAIKAAKEKAMYLLEAIDEELGQPIEIREYNNDGRINTYFSQNNTIAKPNVSFNQVQSEYDQVMFQTFEVKFSYYIKYSIK